MDGALALGLQHGPQAVDVGGAPGDVAAVLVGQGPDVGEGVDEGAEVAPVGEAGAAVLPGAGIDVVGAAPRVAGEDVAVKGGHPVELGRAAVVRKALGDARAGGLHHVGREVHPVGRAVHPAAGRFEDVLQRLVLHQHAHFVEDAQRRPVDLLEVLAVEEAKVGSLHGGGSPSGFDCARDRASVRCGHPWSRLPASCQRHPPSASTRCVAYGRSPSASSALLRQPAAPGHGPSGTARRPPVDPW